MFFNHLEIIVKNSPRYVCKIVSDFPKSKNICIIHFFFYFEYSYDTIPVTQVNGIFNIHTTSYNYNCFFYEY